MFSCCEEIEMECRETNESASVDTTFSINLTPSLPHYPKAPPLAFREGNGQDILGGVQSPIAAINAATSLTSMPSLHTHDPEKTPAAHSSPTDSALETPPDGVRPGQVLVPAVMVSNAVATIGQRQASLTPIGKSFRSGGRENPSTTPLDCPDGQSGSIVDAWRRSMASRGS